MMTDNLGLSDDQKRSIGEHLTHVLADTFTLYLKTHQSHWNVEGPRFFELHATFEEQYREMWDAIDEIAERIRALGQKAPGSYDEFRRLSTVDAGPATGSAEAMLRDLVAGHEALARTIRAGLHAASEVGDDVSADLLTVRLGTHEKYAWMLRSALA